VAGSFVTPRAALHTEAVAGDSWPGFDMDGQVAALRAAAQRIIPNRKRMTREDAEGIIRMEFASRGLPVVPETLAQYARSMHRGPAWSLLHPRQARREGMRFAWPWSPSGLEWWQIPAPVDDAANVEAWRLAGRGVGPLSEQLEPAMCRRISKTEYICVAEVAPSGDHPAYEVEIRITHAAGSQPRVTTSQLRRL
jgi:hypothetical protein